MAQIERASYTLDVQWDSLPAGVFSIDTSLIDGTDTIAATSFNEAFTGTYDDLSSGFAGARVTRGRDDLLQTMLAGTAQIDVRDRDGLLNPAQSGEIVNLVPNPSAEVDAAGCLNAGNVSVARTTSVANTGAAAFEATVATSALTLSGNEITDATRATGTAGDGLTAPAGIGIWPGSTNLVANGGLETNATGWTAVSSAFSRITTTAKFGAASGQVVTSNLVANEGAYHTFGATAAVYSVSAWVRGSGGGTVRMAVRDNAGGSAQTGSAVTLTGSWQRITLRTTALTAATWRVYVETDSKQSLTWQVDGVQAELGSIATPYVHTDGATATRGAARVQAAASLLDKTQAWAAFRIAYGHASTSIAAKQFLFDFRVDSSNNINLLLDSGGRWYASRPDGGGSNVSQLAGAFSTDTTTTVVMAWTSSAIKVSVGGAAFSSAANSVAPVGTFNVLDFGSQAGGSHFRGRILWAATGTGTLSNADAATLHAYGDSGTTLATLRTALSTGSVTAYFPCVTSAYHVRQTASVEWRKTDGTTRIPVTASQPYTFSAYARSGAARTASARIAWRDAGGSVVGSTTVGASASLSTSWQRYTASAAAHASAATAEITFVADDAGSTETFQIDSVQLHPGLVPIAYADGTSSGCRWQGTAHASTSWSGGALFGTIGERLHPIRLRATYAGVTYGVFRGYVRAVEWEPSGRRGIARLSCVDLFYWLERCYPTIASTGATTTGAAIGLILNACDQLDPAARDLDTGDAIPGFSADGSKTALALIGELLEAERGVFYASRNGVATYHDRLSRLSATSAGTVTDIMSRLVAGTDQDVLRNRVRVKRTQNGYTATAELASSISAIGPADLPTIETAYLGSDAQAEGLADWILPLVCEARSHVRELTIDSRTAALFAQILSRDIGDRVTTQAARSGTDDDYILEQIEETVSSTGVHSARWLGSRASAIVPFLVGSSLIDSDDVIVYGA